MSLQFKLQCYIILFTKVATIFQKQRYFTSIIVQRYEFFIVMNTFLIDVFQQILRNKRAKFGIAILHLLQ